MPKLKHRYNSKPKENDEIIKLKNLELNIFNKTKRLLKTNKFLALKAQHELTEVQKELTNQLAKHTKEFWITECSNIKEPNEAYKIHKRCKMSLNRSCSSTIKDLDDNLTTTSQETVTKLFEHAFPDNNHPELQQQPMDTIENKRITNITINEVNELNAVYKLCKRIGNMLIGQHTIH